MKVYSKIITKSDLSRTLFELRTSGVTPGVYIDDSGIREFRPRRGGSGFELFLEGWDERHRRARNQRGGKAATWDDYGLWFAELFKIDPDAEISFYKGVGDFLDSTARYVPRGASAPWSADAELSRLAARAFERARAEEVAA